jgi:phosphatidylglycerophosphatase A
MKNSIATLIATWFGCGYSPFAPGTAGSMGALIPAWILTKYAGWPPWSFAVAALVVSVPGIWAAGVAARNAGQKDPGLVVIDEVAGQWLTLAAAPAVNWKTMLAAFVLFRALDIWKPAPARQLERIPGGAGIVADDLMAGVYGALLLWLAGRLLPGSLQ